MSQNPLRIAQDLAFSCRLLAVLGVLCLSSCTSEDADALGRGPLDTAERFVSAVNEEDPEALRATLTVKAREGLDAGSGFDLAGEPLENVSFGGHTVQGDTATIPMTATRRGKTDEVVLAMKREDGEWRIYAFTVKTGGAEMTLDLEQIGSLADQFATALGESMKQAFEEARLEQEARELAKRREIFEGLRTMSPEEFDRSWQVSTDFRGRSAVAALTELVGELGFPIDFGQTRAALSGPVTRDVRGESRIRAIEAIAADLDCHPVFPSPHEIGVDGAELGGVGEAIGETLAETFASEGGALTIAGELPVTEDFEESAEPIVGAIRFEPGAPEPGFQHVGPIRIAAEAIQQEPQYGTGSVSVVARALGLDPAVTALGSSIGEVMSFEAVLDDLGRELRSNPDVHYYGGGQSFRGALEDTTKIDLKNLLRDVPRIAKLNGTYRVAIPTEVHRATISPCIAGAEGRVGPISYVVREPGMSATVVFSGPQEVLSQLGVFGRPQDGDGQDIRVQYESTSMWGSEEAHFTLQCESNPTSLELCVVTSRQIIEYPFALEGPALPRADEAPESLEPLAFPGRPQPIDLEFIELKKVGTEFPQVVLSVTNHANKDVGTLVARFEYLDRNGKKLEDFPHTLNGPMSFEGAEPLVAAGQTVQHETMAFFFPEGAVRVRITLESVEFLDSSSWTP